jgi:hypothetical protein
MLEDVHCLVCGEPWNRYGIDHGDMAPEEAAAFHRGEGCPACGFGTRQHMQNTAPRPGILAQRVQAASERANQRADLVLNNEEKTLTIATEGSLPGLSRTPLHLVLTKGENA